MPPVCAGDGPVAVTGAGGFLGTALVCNLLEHGYYVRACVRDAADAERVRHLHELAAEPACAGGRLVLCGCDLLATSRAQPNDAAFRGCCAVFHAAAVLERDGKGGLAGSSGASARSVYDGGVEGTRHMLASVKRSGSVKRVVFTSSIAAILHPAEEGYQFSEKDWASDGAQPGRWSIEAAPYAKSKVDAERLAVRVAADDESFDVVSHCPSQVLGPLRCRRHHEAWQFRIGQMIEGTPQPRSFWNIVDCRDVAEAQRLSAESAVARNGSRYVLASTDGKGALHVHQIQAKLRRLFPGVDVAGEVPQGRRRRACACSGALAKRELGLRPRSVEDTLRATVDSLVALGLVRPRPRPRFALAGALWRGARSRVLALARGPEAPVRPPPCVLLKLNRCRGARGPSGAVPSEWQRTVDALRRRGLSASIGVSGADLETASGPFVDWCRELHDSGTFEFWNQGYGGAAAAASATPEFQGDAASQRESFSRTQRLARDVLGFPLCAFGAPSNKQNADTARVLAEDPDCRVWLYGSRQLAALHGFSGLVLVRTECNLEHPTHCPNAERLAASFERRAPMPYLCLQGHPASWDEAGLAAFEQVLDYLVRQGCRFATPSAFALQQGCADAGARCAAASGAVRVAVVGLGRVGFDFHLRHCRRSADFQVVAVVDREPGRRQEARALLPGVAAHAELDELWSLPADEKPELVVIATPTHLHELQAVRSLEHGCHVVIEKPMTTSLAACDRIFAAARRARREVFVYQSQRWTAECLTARRVLQSGLLGPLFAVRRGYNEYRRRTDWQALQKYGGGMLYNYGSHFIDQLLFLVGFPKLTAIDCSLWSIATAGDADDVVKVWCTTADGVLLDAEINTAAVLPDGEQLARKERGVWQLCGKHGTAVLEGECFRVRYFDPASAEPCELQNGLAATGRNYYNEGALPWREELFPLQGEGTVGAMFYENVWDVVSITRSGEARELSLAPAPLVSEQEARELVRVIDVCRWKAAERSAWCPEEPSNSAEAPVAAAQGLPRHACAAAAGASAEARHRRAEAACGCLVRWTAGARQGVGRQGGQHAEWTRRDWQRAASRVLLHAFGTLEDPAGPLVWPRQASVLYPRSRFPTTQEARAERFEGLARVLLIAAPILLESPLELPGGGGDMADWCRRLLVEACDPASARYVGPVEQERPVQQQVEGGILVLALWLGRRWLWEPLPPAGREKVLVLLEALGTRETRGHNWRFSAVLLLSFLTQEGREVDGGLLQGHLRHLLCWSTGDGYYRDGQLFDYYGAWGFHLNAFLWIRFFGLEAYPLESQALLENAGPFLEKYPWMFARDGRQIAWGRSAAYRCAALAPLAAAGYVIGQLGGEAARWGHFRRLCSSSLRSHVWTTRASGSAGPPRPACAASSSQWCRLLMQRQCLFPGRNIRGPRALCRPRVLVARGERRPLGRHPRRRPGDQVFRGGRRSARQPGRRQLRALAG
ncbi:unnamed protein product [Prorocentrum cordatum]|uniref:Uncharacterized protein n=1 Tax=Prorocentrum cordatum TaxID=2364126 RepID=A0ABN9T0V0_9DINO|nr:unnamed protein product [Polarella glacialis]